MLLGVIVLVEVLFQDMYVQSQSLEQQLISVFQIAGMAENSQTRIVTMGIKRITRDVYQIVLDRSMDGTVQEEQ